MDALRVAIVGLGSRGKDTYAPIAKLAPEKMRIVAIADIDPIKVREVGEAYDVPLNRRYSSAEKLLEEDKLADIMIIATLDRSHVSEAVKAIQKGYHIILEKPISSSAEECRSVVEAAHRYNRKVIVCHVLRYTPFYTTLKAILDKGTIGEVVSVMALENVGYWHQAHSFVRGNWRNSDTTSAMLLQKSCHDMDLLLWLTGKTCDSVTSYGDNHYFKKENRPEGATDYCLGGCKVKHDCPFDAEKIYLSNKVTGILQGNSSWPNDVVTLHPTPESVRAALKQGPYGRCVFACDNNVVDHQVVNMNMTDGTTVSFTMCGFTAKNCRYQKFMGTKGEIVADMDKNLITVMLFGKEPEIIDVSKLADDFSGHAGGDNRMVLEFLDMVATGKEPSGHMTSIDQSVESHYCCFAAEESRLHGGEVVHLDKYRIK